MRNPIARLFACTLAAGATLLSGTAHAAIYQGFFDPAAYMGVAQFSIPDGCVLVNGVQPVGVPGCTQVDFVTATVTNQPPPITGTLAFGPQANVATGLRWVGGVLIGLDTGLIFPAGPNGSFANPGGYALQFHSGTIGNLPGPPTVDLLACLDGCGFNELVGNTPATQFPYVRLAAVPEPGSLALLAGAVAAGWLVRRRRSAPA